MFWEFGKRVEISGTLRFHVKDSKSCIVRFCYCSLTGVFKGFRANFLRSSYFPMNHLVRAGKILFKNRVVVSWKVKQVSIPDADYVEHYKFPKWHWGKVPKIWRSWMFPCPIWLKKQFADHVSEYLCRWLDWVFRCEDFTFHFTSSFVQIQTPLTSRWYYTIFMSFFLASTLLALYLFFVHLCIFFIFHQVVWEAFKFINDGLQTNESLVNESNFPSFLYFVYSFSAITWESVQTILYKNQYQCY